MNREEKIRQRAEELYVELDNKPCYTENFSPTIFFLLKKIAELELKISNSDYPRL